ncbi:MAG: sensor histidine kinase [Dehalococcoidia bacterium]
MIPIIYGALVFWWRGALITWLLSLVVTLPLVLELWSDPTAVVTNIAFLLFPLLVVSVLAIELNWRRRQRDILSEREAERQANVSKVFEAQEKERGRIAQELHDGTMQTLLGIANCAETLVAERYEGNDGNEVKRRATWIRDTLTQTVEDLRRITLDLRPSMLDRLGLISALRWLVDCTNQSSSVHTGLFVNGTERKLPTHAEDTIFRVVQEALNNIQRHSKATEATVNLEFATEFIKLTISDNGSGFAKDIKDLASEDKIGLIGAQHRVKSINGTFEIRSTPGKGTTLLIAIPG